MKKFTSFLLAVAMVLSMSMNVFAAVSTDTDKTTVAAGETVNVTVNSDKELTKVGSIEYYVYFDAEKFEFVSLQSVPFGNQAIARQDKEGKWYVSMGNFDMTGDGLTIPAGTLGVLSFQAKETVEEGGETQFSVFCKTAKDNEFTDLSKTEDYVGSETTVTVTPAAPAAASYTVTMAADQSKAVGETAVVAIDVGGEEATYNTYKYVLTYDSDKLIFVTPESKQNVTVTEENGTITVIGYGEDKTCGTDKVALSFIAKTPGAAAVTLTAANIDKSANANVQDAPAAAIEDAQTVINVSNYTVTKDDDFSGADTAAPGEAYTFSVKDKNYDYTVTATMNGQPVAVTDNQDGTFTVANVSGNIEVRVASKTPKQFSVRVDGTGSNDVHAAETATYGTDYAFTVTEAAGYKYVVTVAIGGTAVNVTNNGGGSYAITGSDITGNVVISVSKTEIPVTHTRVTFEDTGSADVVGGTTQSAEIGKAFTFTVAEDQAYTYTVRIGQQELTGENGVYTIPAEQVTKAPITVTVEKTAKVTLKVHAAEYVKIGELGSVWLITATDTLPENKVLSYNGTPMFWSEKYQAYGYLLISKQSLAEVEAEARNQIMQAAATADTINYTGDVNGTAVIDVNDAQLVWNIYNAKYTAFSAASMEMFLRADVNGDSRVDTADAAAVVASIK